MLNRLVAWTRRLVRTDGSSALPPLGPLHIRIPVPQPPDTETGWKAYPAFLGRTPNLDHLECHSSVLMPGQCPHPPHAHPEEEILILLDGEADLMLPESTDAESSALRLRTGQAVYYPAGFPHTLKAAGADPANYLMFKWRQNRAPKRPGLAFTHLENLDPMPAPDRNQGYTPWVLLDAPTGWCTKLQSHLSYLMPGAGYDRHADAHDVALVILSGRIVANGMEGRPCDVLLFPGGEPHDMHNPDDQTARYLVFEFHA